MNKRRRFKAKGKRRQRVANQRMRNEHNGLYIANYIVEERLIVKKEDLPKFGMITNIGEFDYFDDGSSHT